MTTKVFCRLVALLVVLSVGTFLPAVSSAEDSSPAPGGRMAAVLQPFVDSHTLAGAVVLVADKNKVLDVEAVGYADIAAKKPMQTDRIFWIASQTKPITAAVLMMLVDEGKVKLDDPVENYLPEFRGQMFLIEHNMLRLRANRPKHPITIRNLLSHTGGLPFTSPIEWPTLDLFPLEYRVRSYAMLPLKFEPDSDYEYSNAGINTAGRIVEVVSGMPFEKCLDQRLLKPLGMKNTTFWPSKEQTQRLAKAYKPGVSGLDECRIAQLKYPLDDPQRQPMPAGGLFSTAADLRLFYEMIANGGRFGGKQILSEQAVRDMATQQLAAPDYGLGMSIVGDQIGHSGAYGTKSCFDRKHGLIMVFLTQHAGWPKGSENIVDVFQKAAVGTFAPKSQ